MCIQKARQAQVVLMDILLQFSLVGLALEEDLYIAKVRSRVKYGNEIWGVEQSALGFSKNEAPWLRWLYGATRRPRTEALVGSCNYKKSRTNPCWRHSDFTDKHFAMVTRLRKIA